MKQTKSARLKFTVIMGVFAVFLVAVGYCRWHFASVQPQATIQLTEGDIALPSEVKVGPYLWKIRYVELADDYGIADPVKLTIYIDKNSPLDQLKETVLHEIMHTCIYVGNGGASMTGATSDEFIEATAPMLLEVLEQNPKLVIWLQQTEH